MSKNRTLFIISIFLILLPYIGFSRAWEDALTVISGIILFVLSYMYIRAGRFAPGSHVIHSEAKKYYDEKGDFVGSEIDVTEEVVVNHTDGEE